LQVRCRRSAQDRVRWHFGGGSSCRRLRDWSEDCPDRRM